MHENMENIIDIKGLRRMYNKNSCARAVLDHIAGRKYNSVETTVDRLEAVMRVHSVDVSRRELVGALKELENLGCGTFVIGRRGQASRFQWAAQMIGVGRAAKGDSNVIEPLITEEAKSEESEESELAANVIRHSFNLRPDYTVTFDLPSNLSVREATRLAEFVKTLPFDIEPEM